MAKKETVDATNELATQNTEVVVQDDNIILGFEETRNEDLIIPRIKVINALSPERIEGEAQEGDVINSLTKESVVGKRFIPLKQYYSNIWWNPDRNEDNRIFCRSFDGRIGNGDNGTLACAQCKKNQWDNTKVGKDAQPVCTSYLNFLGFFEDDPMPVVLSFSKTNYNEGKKMLSIARSLRASLWNYGYMLTGKKVSKDRNVWYIIEPKLAGDTTPEQRALGLELYRAYETTLLNIDYDDNTANVATPEYSAETESEIS